MDAEQLRICNLIIDNIPEHTFTTKYVPLFDEKMKKIVESNYDIDLIVKYFDSMIDDQIRNNLKNLDLERINPEVENKEFSKMNINDINPKILGMFAYIHLYGKLKDRDEALRILNKLIDLHIKLVITKSN